MSADGDYASNFPAADQHAQESEADDTAPCDNGDTHAICHSCAALRVTDQHETCHADSDWQPRHAYSHCQGNLANAICVANLYATTSNTHAKSNGNTNDGTLVSSTHEKLLAQRPVDAPI